MQQATYDLPPSDSFNDKAVSSWLKLGLIALVAAGLFSILLVAARTPFVQSALPIADFFRIALVIHVNLSVLVWLLAISAALWAVVARGTQTTWDRFSVGLATLGTVIMICSPFVGSGTPQMSNYVPVLENAAFFSGLGLFVVGIASQLLRTLLTHRMFPKILDANSALRAGIGYSCIVVAVALAAFLASYVGVPRAMDGQVYYEYLFWGSGHVMQFAYTLLMMVAWIVLSSKSGCKLELTPRLTLFYLLFLCLPIITIPFLYIAHDITSIGHRLAFTELMKYGGLSCLPMGLAVVASLWQAPTAEGEGRYLRSALHSSIALFAVGGLLGFLIAGLDIVIPAHYHGATVGVTVAFMGLCYYLMPRLGYGPIAPKMAYWQPYLYAGGQLMHITGLAWTGGYGVQRKTAGAAQSLDRIGEIAGMGLMGLGGLISVIGGILFLIVCYRSIVGGKRVAAV